MLFKRHVRSVFVQIGNRLIGNLFFMYTVRLPVCICNGILFKICKNGGKVFVSEQYARQRIVNRIPLLFRRQRRNIFQGIGKSQRLSVCIFNQIFDLRSILIRDCHQFFIRYLLQRTHRNNPRNGNDQKTKTATITASLEIIFLLRLSDDPVPADFFFLDIKKSLLLKNI